MKSFRVTVEIMWEETNIEIVEREAKRELDKIWPPDEYILSVEDMTPYQELFADGIL